MKRSFTYKGVKYIAVIDVPGSEMVDAVCHSPHGEISEANHRVYERNALELCASVQSADRYVQTTEFAERLQKFPIRGFNILCKLFGIYIKTDINKN